MSAAELRQAAHTLRDGGVNRCTVEVGSALADWLDVIASKEKAREGIDSPIPVLYLPEALIIARAILGGAS